MQRIFTLLAGVAVAFSAHAELQHVEVSITWPMANADREAVLTPVITDGFEGYFTADEPVLGSKMYWGVPRTINGVAFNLVQPIETAANADDDGHTVSFKFTVNNGYAFEPTSFEYLGSAIGTSGGNYNLDYTWGGNTTLIQKDFHPNRNKEEYGYFSDVKENLTSTVSDGTFDATFHIYNLVENKQIGLANVTVKGILYIGEGIKPVLTWSAENYEVSLLDENPAYPTLTAEPAENAAEILAGVTYTSSDEEVATVDAEGKITALTRGTTTITATFEANDNYYGATASYTLTVVDPNFIEDTRIQPVLSYSAENYEVDITDENPTYPTLTAEPAENAAEILAGVTYTSSDEEVATVDAEGKITALTRGTTTITATFEANDNYYGATASYTLTVVDPNFIEDPRVQPVLSYSAENYEVDITDENPTYPTLTAEPAENAAEILAGVTYTSSNEEVAAVDADGTVTIVGRGETTITASFEANDNYYCATASYTLTVVDPNFIDKTWDASTWTQSVYSSTVTIDGLTLHATESRLIKASNYLYLNGAAVEEEGVLGRALSFKVPGKVKITIESRSSNQTHTLALAAGEWTNVISMQSFDEKDTKTFCYTGDATTLYIYSTWSSIYIYSIHVVSLPDEETPEAPTAAPTVDVLELDENGNLEIEFNLAEGNVLYYAYTEDAVAPEEAPQRIVYQGTTYEEAEGNTVSLTGVNPGTLKYFVHDPATGMTSERTEVAVHKYGYTTGLVEISANAEAEAEYYTTQGIRVAAPTAAGVYICRKGTEVTKVLVK